MLNSILSSFQRKKFNADLESAPGAYVISFVTLKGGVGKTTLAYEVMQQLCINGSKVLAIDLDPQANLTLALTEMNFDTIEQQTSLFEVLSEKINPLNAIIHTLTKIDLLASNSLNSLINQSQDIRLIERMKQITSFLKTKYDYIIIDCGPTTSVAHALAVMSSDLILTPVTLDPFSLQGLHKTIIDLQSICKAYNHKLQHKILFNKLKPSPYVADLAQKVRDSLQDNLWLASLSDWENYNLAEPDASSMKQVKTEIEPIVAYLKEQKSTTSERLNI